MNRLLLFASILLFSFCDRRDKVPPGIIPPEKMSLILTDLSIAEGIMTTEFILGDSAKKMAPYLYDDVLAKHGTPRKDFLSSLDFYLLHPEKLDHVYDRVLETLSKMESNLE
jgi:hypothetical protein